jgi:hypothetical protein
MTWAKRTIAVTLLAGILAAVLLAGCSKFDGGDPNPNQPPETTLSFAPDPDGSANYRVRMNWFGWDSDGEVAYYWTKWDTLDWVRVVSTDSIFYLSADAAVDQEFGYEYHTFSVKAVDNEGAEDPSAETVSFTAFTAIPETEIIIGPASVTGPMVSFAWLGRDRDGVIVGYRWLLYKWTNNAWVLVGESGPLTADDTTLDRGPLVGRHKFVVWAIDDAGVSDQTPAERIFTCNEDLAGPVLTIRSTVFGDLKFQGPVWRETYNQPTPIFAGERLAFSWSADASNYGGRVRGYRHAYDDTSAWPAWSLFDTRFQVAPTLGRHSLYVSALDNANVMTRARVYFDVVEATMDQYILIVDDWNMSETSPAWGTDAMRSAFYDTVLSGYARDRVEWEPAEHPVSGAPSPPNVDALRGASTVVWYSDGDNSVLGKAFNASTYNALAGYVRVGGNLILEGRQNLQAILGHSYPITVTARDTTVADLFVKNTLHIRTAANSGNVQAHNWNYGYCFYGAVPTDPGMFAPIYIDTAGKWSVMWHYQNNPQHNLWHAGFSFTERLGVNQGVGVVPFVIDSYINQEFEGQPCGVLYLSGDNHGNACYLTFPLYYMKTPEVRPVLDKILMLFGEEKLPGRG